MQLSGHIKMMKTSLEKGGANYSLPVGEDLIDMNALVGKHIELTYNNVILCANCGVRTKKSWSGGYCFPCTQVLARCDLCIMRPETCHYSKGTCREPQWGLNYCFQPTVIYLANTSTPKVGITNKKRVFSRWIEQGAVTALPIIEARSRLDSGKIEVALKQFVADKTNWRNMLKNEIELSGLTSLKESLLGKIAGTIKETESIILSDDEVNISYPVLKYPTKVVSLNFDKTPIISGVLEGIKGQYLLLDCGVLNIRKFSSYHLTISS